jgi:NAD(P)H-nitrite reductase large subunit
MRKVCDQIEQEVQNLLSSLCIEDASHLNPRTLEKCIAVTKNSIIKAIASRIPQVTAIEEKFKNLILEINRDL